MGPVRRHVWVTGRVQGVWFRRSCQEQAQQRGVAGWVRNLPDGRVEAVFEGAERPVAAMVAWCRQGPAHAKVEGVAVRQEAVEGMTAFEVRP